MHCSSYGDFETFMHDVGEDRVFRMNVYSKVFTPFETAGQFIDQSIYENGGYTELITISETIPLPNGDILLGVRSFDDISREVSEGITYYRLSEIRLGYYEKDAEDNYCEESVE